MNYHRGKRGSMLLVAFIAMETKVLGHKVLLLLKQWETDNSFYLQNVSHVVEIIYVR